MKHPASSLWTKTPKINVQLQTFFVSHKHEHRKRPKSTWSRALKEKVEEKKDRKEVNISN